MEPETLIEKSFRLTQSQKKALGKMGLITIRDLLYHFPSRYSDVPNTKHVSELKRGDHTAIFGRISKIKKTKAFRKKIPIILLLPR
ncbi:MAG: hypothetical protein IIB00_06195 [candidate division Zixibacteria bacterium]|nr:hypothetical protein [candidate division Zixibacteria bacterium]